MCYKLLSEVRQYLPQVVWSCFCKSEVFKFRQIHHQVVVCEFCGSHAKLTKFFSKSKYQFHAE